MTMERVIGITKPVCRHYRRIGGMLLFCLIACGAHAEGEDIFNIGGLTNKTSDNYERRELYLDYRNHQREFVWPWLEASDTSLDWGLSLKRLTGKVNDTNFTGERFVAMIGKRISPAFYLEGWGGTHRLVVDNAGTERVSPHAIHIYATPNREFTVRVSNQHDYVYYENLLPAGITDRLAAHSSSLQVEWLPWENLRATWFSRWRTFSDGNSSRNNRLNLMYGFATNVPWIWAGVGAEELNYADQRSNYWSPYKFTDYGLRFDSNMPLTERINLSLAVNLDRIKENDKQGTGKYYSGGLEFKLTPRVSLFLTGNYISSLQSGSEWNEKTFQAYFSGMLF